MMRDGICLAKGCEIDEPYISFDLYIFLFRPVPKWLLQPSNDDRTSVSAINEKRYLTPVLLK